MTRLAEEKLELVLEGLLVEVLGGFHVVVGWEGRDELGARVLEPLLKIGLNLSLLSLLNLVYLVSVLTPHANFIIIFIMIMIVNEK